MNETKKRPLLWGRLSAFVLSVAVIGFLTDQATKLWLLYSFDLGTYGPVQLLPVLDFVLVWNRGISYGLFQQYTDLGRILLIAITLAATVFLWVWGARAQSRLVALALGLVIGGALGNGLDRIYHGAVVDFVHFHVGTFSWYVFNLADVWIVAGVVGLLYDSFTESPNSAAKSG
ncbi:signal peptidase II [Roseibium hamelinense]|nr:signal peptidase II [Roseibium hamelinense]MTI43381.1 signal peptidase II [Roseibium hamelinense]